MKHPILMAVLGMIVLATVAPAQEVHCEVFGGPAAGLVSVRPLGGDANGDGVNDLVAGGINQGTKGGVFLASGVDGSILFHNEGIPDYDLGWWVSGAGDFDGDGVQDYAGGAPDNAGNLSGEVHVYSGATGDEIVVIQHPTNEDSAGFGTRIDPLGDLDRDGYSELAVAGVSDRDLAVVGGPDGYLLRLDRGSLKSGKPLKTASFGDADGDGTMDYVIGRNVGHGQLQVVSGKTGENLYLCQGNSGQSLGSGVAPMGDLDGDGIGDFAASSDFDSDGCGDGTDYHGFLEYRSGVDGAVIWDIPDSRVEYWYAGCSFSDIHGGADVNGDGVLDFIAGFEKAWWPKNTKLLGYSAVYSGATGTMLWQSWTGGYRNALVGDLDGDGLSEWAVGDKAYVNSGRVIVFKGFPGDAQRVCSASPNSSGTAARLSLDGPISISNDALHLVIDGGVPNRPGYFLTGPTLIQQPFGNGVLCVGGGSLSVRRLGGLVMLDQDGFVLMPVNIGTTHAHAPGWEPGSTWVIQFLYSDPAAGGAGFNLSDAMLVTFTS